MSERRPVIHLLLLGAVAGTAVADLLIGLNPQLRSGWVGWILSFAVAGALVAGVAAALLGRFLLDPPPRGRWAATAAGLGLFALFVESQRLLYHPFVANATRRVLVAAAIVAGAGAGAFLVAGALRPARRRAALVVAAVLVLLALAPLTAHPPAGPPELSSPAPVARAPRRSLLVVGLDGVSWNLVVQGAADGKLPVLRRLLEDGAAGPLEPLVPWDRDPLWITAATGKKPSRHGVVSSVAYETPLGIVRIWPRPFGFEAPESLPFSRTVPLNGDGRLSLAFWEILAARGHEASVLNWPATPARKGLLLWAPEEFFGAPPAARGLPKFAADRAALFRVESTQLEKSVAAALVPKGLGEKDLRVARPLEGAARDLSVVGAALAALPRGEGSSLTLVLSGMAAVARAFGPAVEPARYWNTGSAEADVRGRALLAYYRFLDDLLGELLQGETSDRTVCVFSPASFGPPATTAALAKFLAGRQPASVPDASPGFFLLSGNGLRKGIRLTSVTIYDLVPTLLALAGEPIARDLDGRVLAEAFDERFAESTSLPIVTTFEPRGPQ